VSKSGAKYDLRHIFEKTVVKLRPGDAVTFVDNHDTQIGQSLESWVGKNFKLQAYALILLRQEGHPCVFYGDLYPNKECYDEKIAAGLRLLLQARKKFAYGAQRDYFLESNCIGFVREGDKSREPNGGCAVLISNANDVDSLEAHSIRMNVGSRNAGKKFRSFLDANNTQEVETAADGWAAFPCPHGSLRVWISV